MIYYKTNQNWFGDLAHLARSWTMVRIVRSVLGIGLYTLLVCLAVDYFHWQQAIMLNVSIFSLLGVILSIFLVFRTNTAYDRWWEGRKQWGALVNHSRNLAVYTRAMFPEKDTATHRFMAVHISNFCLALAEHLREGVMLEELIELSEEDKTTYSRKDHIPNYISLRIFQQLAQAHRDGRLNEGDYINIKAQHQALLDILGACERIKKTPIPFSYSVYLKIFITAYGLLIPFALVGNFGFFTIPLVMFLFFALLGVELLGEEIEDPFGRDCNDLPTVDIARTIQENVFEILGQEIKKKREEPALYEKIF